MTEKTFDEIFPSLTERYNDNSIPKISWDYETDIFFIRDIQKHCLDKAKVKEAIINNNWESLNKEDFVNQLLDELGLEE